MLIHSVIRVCFYRQVNIESQFFLWSIYGPIWLVKWISMADFLHIHPINPERRLIKQVVDVLLTGGVIVYPTDSTYALGCHIGDKLALERIRRIRQLDARHNFTLVCSDLSSLAIYARVHNSAYRILKAYTPGPYTFILKATSQVPKRLMHPKRKTIGLRVPDNSITQSILSSFGEPVMSTSLILPDEDKELFDAYEMRTKIGKMVDLIIDGGACGLEPTTMIDLVEGVPEVMRIGKGDPEPFQ